MILRKINGIILQAKPLGEYDRLLSVFSEEYGRLSILAKGIRRFRSQRSFHVDLLNIARMELEENGHREKTRRYLREISSLDTLAELKENPVSFGAACLIASFLLRTLPQETPQSGLFELTCRMLISLNERRGEPLAPMLLEYFLEATRLLGFLPKNLAAEITRPILWKTLQDLDPQFALQARTTLGIFSNFERRSSN